MCLVSWHMATRPLCIEKLVTIHSGSQLSYIGVHYGGMVWGLESSRKHKDDQQ